MNNALISAFGLFDQIIWHNSWTQAGLINIVLVLSITSIDYIPPDFTITQIEITIKPFNLHSRKSKYLQTSCEIVHHKSAKHQTGGSFEIRFTMT